MNEQWATASVGSFEIPKVLNSTEDAQAKSMSMFEADEHLQTTVSACFSL
jgi:hypothetical protein